MRKLCSFMVIFTDGADGRFMESYCLDRADALAQVKEIFMDGQVLDVVLFRVLE